MYQYKAVNILLAVLLVVILIEPALAVPSVNQALTTPATNDPASTSGQSIATPSVENTGATSAQELEQALADAEIAVRQTQAERIKQELDSLGDELERLNTDYVAESAKLVTIEKNLSDTREKLRWFEAEFEAQRQILSERLANIYKHGDLEPIEAIVNNSSFSEIFTRLSLLLKISEQDAELLQDLRDQKLKVEAAKNALDHLYAQQKEITAELEGRRKTIEAKIKQETDLLASIDEETKAILERERAEQQQEQTNVINRLAQQPQQVQQAQQTRNNKIALQPGTIGFEAIQYLGVPYVWGGEDPSIGLDCSGLVKIVFRKFGVDLPHYSRAQAELGASVSYDELQPGDLVFFGRPIHHVGIYLGEGYFIHAPRRNDVVKISRMNDRSDHAGARRIVSILPSNIQ